MSSIPSASGRPGASAGTRRVVYKGPFECACGDDGTEYPRGVAVEVAAGEAERLRLGPAADQFVVLAG